MKLKVAIVEKDSRFLDRLVGILSKNYADQLEIYPYTDPEVALSTLEFMKINILIAEESFHILPSSFPKDCVLTYFVSDISQDTCQGQRAICKYQRAELIFKQIIGVYTEASNCNFAGNGKGADTKTIVFTSPIGGVGVSTAAAACALRFANSGKRILYLDLDDFGCPGLFFHGDNTLHIGDILSTLRNKNSDLKNANLADLLDRAVCKDSSGVFFYSEAPDDSVWPALSSEEISKLLRELRIIGTYDYLILDIPFTKIRGQVDIMDKTKQIVLLSDSTERSYYKLPRAYQAFICDTHSDEACAAPEHLLLFNQSSGFQRVHPILSELKTLGSIPLMQIEDCRNLIARIASMELFDVLI